MSCVRIDDGKLIDLVNSFPHLYDRKRSDFKDIKKKENSWQYIAKVLNYTATEVQQRWRYLREKYSRERNVQYNLPSGSRAKKSEWEYYHSLKWLEPYMQKRKTRSHIEAVMDIETLEDDLIDTNSNLVWSYTENISDESEVLVEEAVQIQEQPEPAQDTTMTPKTSNSKSIRNRRETDMESTINAMGSSISSVAEVLKKRINNTAREDEEKDILFGKMVGIMLKSHSTKRKKQLKKQIFNSLLESESE